MFSIVISKYSLRYIILKVALHGDYEKLVTNVGMVTPDTLKTQVSVYGGDARGNSANELRAELLEKIDKMFEPWKTVERDVLAEISMTRGVNVEATESHLRIFQN